MENLSQNNQDSQQKSGFAITPAYLFKDPRLNFVAASVGGVINGWCHSDKGYCDLTKEQFKVLYNIGRRQLDNAISALIEAGYVTVEVVIERGKRRKKYHFIHPKPDHEYEKARPSVQNVPTREYETYQSKEVIQISNTNKDTPVLVDHKGNERKLRPARPDYDEEVEGPRYVLLSDYECELLVKWVKKRADEGYTIDDIAGGITKLNQWFDSNKKKLKTVKKHRAALTKWAIEASRKETMGRIMQNERYKHQLGQVSS
jgi:hypothetical protein